MNPASSLSLLAQIRHQFRMEWLHHHRWCLAVLAFIGLRLAYRLNPFWQIFSGTLGEPIWITVLNLLIPAALVMRIVFAEPVASPDLGTLTRPISDYARFLGKSVFLTFLLLVPWILADVWLLRGFGHTGSTWTALLLGSAMGLLIPCLLVAAMTSLAATGAQLAAFVLGLLLVYFGAEMLGFYLQEESAKWMQALPLKGLSSHWRGLMNSLGFIISMLFFAGVWAWQTIGRRRGSAATFLLVGVMLAFIGLPIWLGMGWLREPASLFEAGTLKLVTGPAPSASAQSLWPTVHVTGLPPRHMVSMVAFAPVGVDIDRARSDWHPARSPYYGRDDESALQDFARSLLLMRESPLGDLTHTRFDRPPAREPLRKVLGPTLPTTPWRMKLAVYEMRRILDLPLADFRKAQPGFLLKSGQRVAFEPLEENRSAYTLPWVLRSQRSHLLPGSPLHRGELSRFGEEGMLNAWAVLRDRTARENHIMSSQNSGRSNVRRDGGQFEDVSYAREFYIDKPLDRIALAGLKLQDWLQTTDIEIWVPEFRGIRELDVSVETMEKMLQP